MYLPWSSSPDNSSYNYGTMAFVLISTKNNVLSKDSVGIDDPVIHTTTVPVYSWLGNETIGRLGSVITIAVLIVLSGHAPKSAFMENVTISFHFWPIACSIYVETVMADVRGDNYLLSYTTNTSNVSNTTTPFVRLPPTSPLERNWASVLDQIYASEIPTPGPIWQGSVWQGLYAPSKWLENRILALLKGTTSTSAQKLGALETDLQSITSVAYSLLFEQIYNSGNFTGARYPNVITVLGQERVPLAKLQVNGLQVFVGLICTLVLLACVLISSGLGPVTEESSDVYMLSGEVLDLMCLMKNSALPELLNSTGVAPSNTGARRAKAEKLNVVLVYLPYHHLSLRHLSTETSRYSRLRLDSQDYRSSLLVGHSPCGHGVSRKFIPDQSTDVAEEKALDVLQMTENALARLCMSLAIMNYNK